MRKKDRRSRVNKGFAGDLGVAAAWIYSKCRFDWPRRLSAPPNLRKPARMMEGGGESKRMQVDLMGKIKKSAESDRRGGDV